MLKRLSDNWLEHHTGLKKTEQMNYEKLSTANASLHLVFTKKSELNLKMLTVFSNVCIAVF